MSGFGILAHPTVRIGLQLQKTQREMKNTVMPSLTLDGQPTSSHQAQQSVTLQRFVVSRELTSKASSIPADIQVTKSAEDECIGSSLSASAVQAKSSELSAHEQSDETDAMKRFATRRSPSTVAPLQRAHNAAARLTFGVDHRSRIKPAFYSDFTGFQYISE